MNIIPNVCFYIHRVLHNCYTTLILDPSRSLYLESPSLGSIGGWSGVDEAHICTQITNVPVHHWEDAGIGECSDLINKRFYSTFNLFLNGFRLFLVFLVIVEMYTILRHLLYVYFFRNFVHDQGPLTIKNSKVV